jgi:hypothetical protein
MASGDIVFQADDLSVNGALQGKRPAGIAVNMSHSDGWRLGLGGGAAGGEVLADLVFVKSTPPTFPFDPAKTYDVIIKEH